jgi:hypothetical protein
MLTSGPLLALVLPMLDLSDLPPMEIPPMPAGASRVEMHAGWYVAKETGMELEGGLVGAGYLVRFSDGSNIKRGTLASRVALSWFTAGESEKPVDSYWVGPFMRIEAASELMGRHRGLDFGTVNRAAGDLGFRFPLSSFFASAGSIAIGYAVAHDREGTTYKGPKHGVRLQVDFALK